MNSIGLTGIGAMNVAGSAAGTQSGGSDTDRIKQNGAAQQAAADRNAQSARSLGDVAEADHSADRDADGRQPWGYLARLDGDADVDENEAVADGTAAPDAAGERGNRLDLEA